MLGVEGGSWVDRWCSYIDPTVSERRSLEISCPCGVPRKYILVDYPHETRDGKEPVGYLKHLGKEWGGG